jgi:hypothetical protein
VRQKRIIDSKVMSVTRSLSLRERAAVDALLAAEYAGAPELPHRPGQSWPATNNWSSTSSLISRFPKPSSSIVCRCKLLLTGRATTAVSILYVEDGRLSGLEYWWVTEEMPDDFPPVSAIGTPIVAK